MLSEGQDLQVCQIWKRHLNPRLRYNYFRFRKTNGRHIEIILPVSTLIYQSSSPYHFASAYHILCESDHWRPSYVLFCSLAVLNPRVGHTMDVLSPFISIICHSDWLPQTVLSTTWCCLSRPCVVFLACVHLALFLALLLSPGNSLVSSWYDHSMLASSLW